MMKKTKITFGKVLLGIILLLAVAIGAVLRYEYLYLADYEAYHPENMAQDVLSLYREKEVADIVAYTSNEYDALFEHAMPFMDFSDAFMYQTSASGNTLTYDIINNNAKFATLTLAATAQTSKFGFPIYEVASLEQFPAEEMILHYPKGAALYRDESLLEIKQEPCAPTELLENAGLPEIEMCSVKITDFITPEHITAMIYGLPCNQIIADGEVLFTVAMPTEHIGSITTFAEGFVKAYARYTTLCQVPSKEVLTYVQKGSVVEKGILDYSNYWGKTVARDNFLDLNIGNFARIAQDAYCVDVHMTYEITRLKGQVLTYPVHFKVYLQQVDDTYEVYELARIDEEIKETPFAQTYAAYSPTMTLNGKTMARDMLDDSIYTSHTMKENDVITVGGSVGYVYIKWATAPTSYQVSFDGQEMTYGEHGFLHELITVPEGTKEVQMQALAGNAIAEFATYPAGTLPPEVQAWEPPLAHADLLAFPTHADDDTLFFGALLSEYAAKGKAIQLAYLVNHNNTVDRPHELLDGMWAMGLRAYPVISDLPDCYSETLEHAQTIYDSDAMLQYEVENIRRFTPNVIIGHDLKGEYGHGVHMLGAHLLTEAVSLASDATYDAPSQEKYGLHETPKLYLHMYPKNQLVLDVHQTMYDLNGLSPFQQAEYGYSKHLSQHIWPFAVKDFGSGDCRLFGLYASTVGYEDNGDLFAGIPA